jgi:mono/diheme cytochrome c family protein
MKATSSVVVLCLILFAITTVTGAPPTAPDAKIERGKYLVERVGMCGDCHTPHNEKGEPIREKWLQGSSLSFKPVVPIPVWADKTPNIAGLPGWEEKEAIKFLMTGIAYNELPGRPPMPQYRFNHEDASAIVAYLRSLASSDAGTQSKK